MSFIKMIGLLCWMSLDGTGVPNRVYDSCSEE